MGAGRRIVVLEQERHCILCGNAVRQVELLPPGGAKRTSEAHQHLWLVDPDGRGGLVSLRLHNTGSVPATIEEIRADTDACSVSFSSRKLDAGGQADLPLAINVNAISLQRNVALTAYGNFRERSLALRIRVAPRQFVARPAPDDQWSRSAARNGGWPEQVTLAGAEEKGRGLLWGGKEQLALAINDAFPETAVEIAVAGSQGLSALSELRHASITWQGQRPVDCQLMPSGGHAVLLRLRLADELPVEGEITGRVVVEFDSISPARIEVPIRLVPGRPMMRAVGMEDLLLPTKYPSQFRVRFESAGRAENAALLDLIDDRAIRVEASADGAQCTVRRETAYSERRGTPAALEFSVRITPPPTAMEGQIRLRLVIPIGQTPAVPLSLEQAMVVQFVDPADEEDGRMAAADTFVIDFGTTNTCLARIAPEDLGPPEECFALESLTASYQDAAIIPTRLYLKEGASPENVEAVIGRPALLRHDRFGDGALFDGFKPSIGSGKPIRPSMADVKLKQDYSADELTFLFLRELLLEIRGKLEQRPLGRLLLTYPATFSIVQREALRSILERLKPWGIAGEARAALDEANAGAFGDLRRHLREAAPAAKQIHAMIFDFGGGTIDIAVLAGTLLERSPARTTWELRPLGLTGLRDFGGNKITRAIALLLAQRLGELQKSKSIGVNDNGWIPLPPPRGRSIRLPSGTEPIAESNLDFLREIAEHIKTQAYGSFAEFEVNGKINLPPDRAWYVKLGEDLIERGLPEFPDEITGRLRRVTGMARGNPTSQEIPSSEWMPMLRSLKLTRTDVDKALMPALLEAFGRAQRLWDAVRPVNAQHVYRPPELLLLAGSSSQLPVIWKLAESPLGQGGLEYPAANIRFDVRSAKRKVALGAALYQVVDREAGRLFIKPRPASDYVLIPIVHRVEGTFFEPIFKAGDKAGAGQTPVMKNYPVSEEQVTLSLYENMDLRDQAWKASPELLALGVDAPGKEFLARFDAVFADINQTDVVHTLIQEPGGRSLRLEFKGPNSPLKQRI